MWPGEGRRNVPWSSPTHAVRAPISAWLQAEAKRAGETLGRYRLLDVGCGVKPYYPFFEPFVSEYVGVDVVENPAADLLGPIEALPVDDASFDLVLCSQVLEHCDEPAQAVRELRRVTRPGGRVLASTHGVQVYHPSPVDLWRWTHAGLERLFTQSAAWSSVDVQPSSGTTACLGMLASIYIDLLSRRVHLAPVGRALVSGVNRAAATLDGSSSELREVRSGALIANFHVVADA